MTEQTPESELILSSASTKEEPKKEVVLMPGDVLVFSDGTRYLVGKNGNYINLNKAERKYKKRHGKNI